MGNEVREVGGGGGGRGGGGGEGGGGGGGENFGERKGQKNPGEEEKEVGNYHLAVRIYFY